MFFRRVFGITLLIFLTGATYNPGRSPIEVEDVADGTADHVLGWDGSGVAVSQSRDGARAFNSGNISIPNTSWTSLALNSEHWDDNDLHSTSTNTSRLTATVEGRYIIVGQVRWASNSSGVRGLRVFLNGTVEIGKAQQDGDSNGATIQDVTTIFTLAAADFVELQGFQNSGGSLNAERIVDHSIEFMMQRLRSE